MSVIPRVRHVSLPVQTAPGQAQGHGHGRRQGVVRAIVLPRQELERIRSHSRWLSDQARDGEQRRAQMQRMKATSEALVGSWKNTVLNKQKERLERRQKRIQNEDERRNAEYRASLQEAAEERKKRIEDAKRMLLFEQDDIQQVNSAFVFSEVLHERSKQVEFNEHLKKIEEQAREERAEQIKRDLEVYREEEEKRKEREHKAKMERKTENIKMMKEKAEREAFLLAGEKAEEKQDLLNMEKEIKLVQENIDREARRKKEQVRKAALESIEMNNQKIKMQKQEEEDEEKVIQIYLRVKERMEWLRKKHEAEARKAKHEHQERIRATIAESLKEKVEDIDGMVAKALQEREVREAELVQKRKEYEAKLLKERKEYHAEVEEQKKKDKKEEQELKQWLLMQSLKRDEIDKIHKIKRKELEWNTKMRVREGYNEQLREFKDQERIEDFQRHQKLLSQIEKEDADFFDYAQEVLNECKIGGRPLYPIQKTIHEYRKKHGIINREKYEKWAKDMAELDRQYREEEEEQDKQLAIIDETPGACKPLFPPLLKKCPI
ncbi:hypothetical protein ONE63_010852 [Megalurothrips usitatus]|uniref:Trichohyalin-plectin-homology domain-containing protein n=1 Tax=Megalurothrips usitatus TaxID=439358 RepID=A0AAV7XIX0_9NEOP|nr:hypothetical protein ONE63_010852 [Megalurothrips usitatus]